MTNNNNEKYREKKNDDSDEEDNENNDEKDDIEEIESNLRDKNIIKCERNSPMDEQRDDNSSFDDSFTLKPLAGLHLTFNLEAGSLLPLAIKGRVMHGRHFTFKSILSHTAITMVATSVTGTLVSCERPYVLQGPWLQVLIPDELAERMAYEFQIFNAPDQVSLLNFKFNLLI